MMDQLGGGVLPPSNHGGEEAGRTAVNLIDQQARVQRLEQEKQAQEAQKKQAEQVKEPRTEKTVQQVRSAWLQKSLADWVEQVEAELLQMLLDWEPGAGTLEENVRQLQQLLSQYGQQLNTQGQPLMMDAEMEEALLRALSRLLVGQMGEFLRMAGPAASHKELESLLHGLFTQITGGKASQEGLSNGAAMLRQLGSNAGAAGRTARYSAGEGIIYQPAPGAGGRMDRVYGGAGTVRGRSPYPIYPSRCETGIVNPAISDRSIQLARRFALFLQSAQPIPKAELPFTSEEKLGLELGMISLYGEITASRPGLGAPLATLVRGATEHYVQGQLSWAAQELGHYAVHHPPVSACPAYHLDAVMQVYHYLLRAYHKVQDPEQAVIRAVKYALAQFQGKQEELPYQSWLRYCMGRNFFDVLQDMEQQADLKRGWEQICSRWNQFLKAMECSGARFRASIWGMVLKPTPGFGAAGDTSFSTAGRWILIGAGVVIVLVGLLPNMDILVRAGCLVIGAAIALVAALRR